MTMCPPLEYNGKSTGPQHGHGHRSDGVLILQTVMCFHLCKQNSRVLCLCCNKHKPLIASVIDLGPMLCENISPLVAVTLTVLTGIWLATDE